MELLPGWNVVLDARCGVGLHWREKSGFGADRFSIVGVVVLYGGRGGSTAPRRRRCRRMADLCGYANRPLAFIFRYVRLRPLSHAVILTAVLAAVACSVSTQYGVKHLVDVLSSGASASVWMAFLLLASLIAADNLLWRIAAWISNFAFVGEIGRAHV